MREFTIIAIACIAALTIVFASDPEGNGSGTPSGALAGLAAAGIVLAGMTFILR